MVLNEKKNTSEFNADLIKNYDENSNKGYIFEVDFEYPKRFHNLYSNLPFLPERMKIKNGTCLHAICMIKTTMLYTRKL